MVANFILLFHVKENLKEVFNRALFLFRFPHFCLTLPLVFNESISGHLDVKDFSPLGCESHLLLIIFYHWQGIWALQQSLITVFIQ